MIHKNLLKFSLLCLIAAPALSEAHMHRVMKDAPMKDLPQATISWEGFYLGANIGGAFSKAHLSTSTVFGTDADYFGPNAVASINRLGSRQVEPNSVTGGVQGGYDYQIDNFVIGIETDFDYMGLNHSTSATGAYTLPAGATFNIKQSVKTNWVFTARPRLGYAMGNVLIYGTAGYALTDVTYRSTFTDAAFSAFDSGRIRRNLNGWTAGAGIEYQFTNNWSVRGEYLFMDFGNTSTRNTNLVANLPPLTAFPNNAFTHREKLHVQTVNFAVNYRF